MNIIEITDGNLKICGWNALRIRYKKENTRFYALGLPLFKIKNDFDEVRADFAKNKSFDVSNLDKRIDDIISTYQDVKGCTINPRRIAFMATKIYDMGGHTKWMRDMQKTLASQYEETLFLTTTETSRKAAPQTLAYLQKISKIKTFKQFSCSYEKNVREIYDSITDYAPQAIFVFIHTDDAVATAVLALLKRYTDIKIFFVNHATHRPALAMSFADLVLEETPSSAYVTQKLRKIPQTHIVGLISKPEEENPQFSAEEIADMRQKMGIPQGKLCTMSGAASYKFFDTDNSSRYFEMVAKLLTEHPDLYHVVITEMRDFEAEFVQKMFADSPVKERLILLPYQKNYELAFKCADLFIDSFPMSSALAFIDLMRLKVPYVVKINTENAALSFHEYQAPDFPYMYETVEQMYAGIEELLADETKRLAMTEKNYRHYLDKYEPKAAEKILQKVINCTNYSSLYDNLESCAHYALNFDDM